MVKKWPLVSVVVLTYNSQEHIKECLTSIYRSDYPNFEVLVVDNASKDKTLKVVKNKFPQATIISSVENLGYTGGNNLGISKSKGEDVFILNPDTVVEENCLTELVGQMGKDPQIAACQPKVLLFKERNFINTTQTLVNFLGFGWCGNFRQPKEMAKTQEINFFSGSAVLLEKKALEKVGDFDDDFFMYLDDVDLSWRLKLAGYKIFSVGEATVYHKYSYRPEENYQPQKQKLYHLEKNRIMTLFKNLEGKTLILIFPAFILMEMGMMFYALLGGWLKEKLTGYFFFLKNFSKICQKRKEREKLRKKDDRFLSDVLFGEVEFEELKSPILKYFVNPLLGGYWFLIKRFL